MYLLSFFLGFLAALIWARFILATVARKPLTAALLDGGIMLPPLIVKQLWAVSGDDFTILIMMLVGSMFGTYLGVKKWH